MSTKRPTPKENPRDVLNSTFQVVQVQMYGFSRVCYTINLIMSGLPRNDVSSEKEVFVLLFVSRAFSP